MPYVTFWVNPNIQSQIVSDPHANTGLSLPGWQGSTQRCTAVGEYVSVAVRVIIVFPSFRRPRPFDLKQKRPQSEQ